MIISVGARSSKLSRVQVEEILAALRSFHPDITFSCTFFETTGDRDQKTSLRTLDKTDFFTKEIDEAQAKGDFRISIHSAKDLPDPLPQGLVRVALTAGVDSRDALVLREHDTVETLKKNARIACSSERREEAIKELRADFVCTDIRGTIEKRLEQLFCGQVDGVIIAKAALIRLGFDGLNHIILNCPTVPFQGRLAVIARVDDLEMQQLFSCIDKPEKKRLYLGLESPDSHNTHFPIIETHLLAQNKEQFLQVEKATNLIMTSKTAVRYFLQVAEEFQISPTAYLEKSCFSVGKETTRLLEECGFQRICTATNETSDGVIEKMMSFDLQTALLFWPHSAKSSRKIPDYLHSINVQLVDCVLYDTTTKKHSSLPNIAEFDELFFSSPSCVTAYLELFGALPKNKTLLAQGPVTEKAIKLSL